MYLWRISACSLRVAFTERDIERSVLLGSLNTAEISISRAKEKVTLTVTRWSLADPSSLWAFAGDLPRASHSGEPISAGYCARRILSKSISTGIIVARLSDHVRLLAKEWSNFWCQFWNRSVSIRLLVWAPWNSRNRVVKAATDWFAFLRRYSIPAAVFAL